MSNLVDFKERVIKTRLTKKESEIAEYIIYNTSKVCFMSASDLAKELNTSNTSVNRMAKALGYDGYNNLNKELQDLVAYNVDANDEFRLPLNQRIIKVNENKYSPESLITKYFELASNNIMSVISKNTPDKIDRVVEIIAESSKLYISGYRGSVSIAGKFGFLMRLIMGNVIIVTGEEIENIESIMDIGKDDCMVMFSFNRYKKNALDLIRICKERSTKLILITDRATAPFSQYADELLVVDVDSLSFFNSSIAPIFLMELICTKLTLKLGDSAKERLDLLEPYINKTQIL